MGITTLNTIGMDGVIIKKGGGSPTPPSGGDKTLYFDVSNVDPNEREFICRDYQTIIVSSWFVGPAYWVFVEMEWLKREITKIGVIPCMAGLPYEDGIIELTSDMIREEMLGLGATEISKEEFYPTLLKKGVFIQHIDGTLYRGWEWAEKGFSGDEANGVAVISDEASLVVAKDSLGEIPWSSKPNVLIDGVTTADSYDIAMNYNNGVEDTAKIAAFDPDSAAAKCANYTFPNGQKGYLPSLREIRMMGGCNEALELIGGAPIDEDGTYYWSSIQWGAEEAWTTRIGMHDFLPRSKSRNNECRPVCAYIENK